MPPWEDRGRICKRVESRGVIGWNVFDELGKRFQEAKYKKMKWNLISKPPVKDENRPMLVS